MYTNMTIYICMVVIINTVHCMPAIDILEENVIVGNTFVMKCELDNTEDNVIIWKHTNRVLFAGDIRVRHDDRIEVIDNLLVIEDIKPSDKGVYTCEIENSEAVFRTFSTELNVLEPSVASINQVGDQLSVKEGTTLALRCSGAGVPTPEVRWRKGDKEISKGIGEAGVVLEYLTRHDQGDIVCEAFNGVGNADEDILTLDIMYAPEVKILPPLLSFLPKCGMEIQCEVHSSSPPHVNWFYNDLLLQPKDGVTSWSLDNIHVIQIDYCDHNILGQFTCKAHTNMGEGETVIDITKEFIQKKMEEIVIEDITNNVRRNVIHQALPLVSSVNSNFLSYSVFIVFCFCMLV